MGAKGFLYTSDRCNNMDPDWALWDIGCRYEGVLKSQQQEIRMFIVGIFTLENVITMFAFATVIILLYILIAGKLREREVMESEPDDGGTFCINCGYMNAHKLTHCDKCGNFLTNRKSDDSDLENKAEFEF